MGGMGICPVITVGNTAPAVFRTAFAMFVTNTGLSMNDATKPGPVGLGFVTGGMGVDGGLGTFWIICDAACWPIAFW